MNWLNLMLFVLLYAASCLPMWAAGRTEDLKTKQMHCIVDAILSIASFVYLWYAFPNTMWSVLGILGWITASGYVGVLMRRRGYDPYAELRP